MLRLRQYLLQTNAYRSFSNSFGCVAPFEEDDFRNEKSVSSNEPQWRKHIQGEISQFQLAGNNIEYSSPILQQLAINQCQDILVQNDSCQLTVGTSHLKKLLKKKEEQTKLSDGLSTLFRTKREDASRQNKYVNHVIGKPKVQNINVKESISVGDPDSGYSTPPNVPKVEVNPVSKKSKSFADFVKKVQNQKEDNFDEYRTDYKNKIKFDLENRLSILNNKISPTLNVEVNKAQVATCLKQARYLSPDAAYWNFKIEQYGIDMIEPEPEKAFKSLQMSSKMGHPVATSDLESIRSKYENGDYSSLIQSYSVAGPEILDEQRHLDTYSIIAKNRSSPVSEPLFTQVDFSRISSNPGF